MRGGLVSRFVQVDGERWHVRMGGPLDAPPLVMVHGLVISSRYLLPLARLFGRTHRLYLPDLPGFGRSSKPPEAWDVAALARGLARWMDAEGVPRAAVLGNSFGCQLAVELAALAPAHVERLVLVGPTMDPEAGAWGNARRLVADIPRESPGLWFEQVPDAFRAGARRALATYRHALGHPILDRARLASCPALVVRGARDPIAPRAWAQRVADAFPDGRLVEVEGAHALNYTAPRALEPVVRAFLAEGAPPPAPRPQVARRRWAASR